MAGHDTTDCAAEAFAEEVQQRRDASGYAQAEIVDYLQSLGISISRSHYCNLEKGRGHFRPTHMAALSALLDVSLTRLSSEDQASLGQVLQALPDLRLGEDLRAALEASSDSLPVAPPPRLGAADEVTVLTDVEEAKRHLGLALGRSAAAMRTMSRDQRAAQWSSLHLIGLGAMARDREDAHLSDLWRFLRGALVDTMRAGWECRHLIPRHDGLSHAGLARWVASLLACEQYRPVVVDDATNLPGNLLLIPAIGDAPGTAFQFIGGTGGTPLRTHVLRDADVVASYLRHADHLARQRPPFVVRTFRAEPGTASTLDADEIEFYRSVTERAGHGAWACYSIGWFPNWIVPEAVFARMIQERAEEAGTAFLPEWHDLEVWHRERRKQMCERVRQGLPVKVLISAARHRAFRDFGSPHAGDPRADRVASVPSWRCMSERERRSVLDSLDELVGSASPGIEIRVRDDDEFDRFVDTLRVEVRGGKSESFVIVGTPRQDGEPSAKGTAEFLIEGPLGVAGFKAYFDILWQDASPLTGSELEEFVREA